MLLTVVAAGLPASGQAVEGPAQPVLGTPAMEMATVFSNERFPNVVVTM